MTALHWASATSVTMPAALQAAGFPGPVVGLVSTTAWHGFVRVAGGVLDRDGAPLDPMTVFDARFFAEGPIELRWVHESVGSGRAVLLAEDRSVVQAALAPFGSAESQPIHDVFEQTFLLWGRSDAAPSGRWQPLREHRVGTLQVPGLPAAAAEADRAGLLLREYVVEDEYGNVSVFDELLYAVRWLPATRWGEPPEETSTFREDVT